MVAAGARLATIDIQQSITNRTYDEQPRYSIVAILRVNQIAAASAEQLAGWTDGPGAIATPWPSGTGAYELRIVQQDGEAAASEGDLRQRLRRLVCEAVSGLTPVGGTIVARLDGPLAGVVPALAWGLDKMVGMSPVRRWSQADPPALVSFRVAESGDAVASLCDAVGPALGRDVRLRVFAVPDELVQPLLDIDELDDERWREIFEASTFAIDTVAGLKGLILFTRIPADDVTTALAKRLSR